MPSHNSVHALQIVVQGISWKAREEQLRELFAEIGEIESASVVMGRDGRSRVRPMALALVLPAISWECTQLQNGVGYASYRHQGVVEVSRQDVRSPSDLMVDQVFAGTALERSPRHLQASACTCTRDAWAHLANGEQRSTCARCCWELPA